MCGGVGKRLRDEPLERKVFLRTELVCFSTGGG
jgi:hypothetical protein